MWGLTYCLFFRFFPPSYTNFLLHVYCEIAPPQEYYLMIYKFCTVHVYSPHVCWFYNFAPHPHLFPHPRLLERWEYLSKKTCAQNTLLVRNAEILVGSEGHSILLSFYGETNVRSPNIFVGVQCILGDIGIWTGIWIGVWWFKSWVSTIIKIQIV